MRLLDWTLVLLLSLSWLKASHCFPNGSVAMSCESLLPGHPPFDPSTSSPPFTLSTSAATYRPGALITVTLEVKENATAWFQGFLLQARSNGQQELWPVGTFNNINASLFTSLKCNDKTSSSVSQANTEKKNKVQLTWEAPNNTDFRDVYFRATVIQSYSTFWVNVNSRTLSLEKSQGRPAAVISSTLLLLTLFTLSIHL